MLERMSDLLEGRSVTTTGAPLPIAGLHPILRRCVRRNPADRYRSAEFILSELQALRLAAAPDTVDTRRRGRTALWWWQLHQAILAAVIASMPVAVWFVRGWDRTIGARLFLAVLALSTISVTIRLNLLFTSRVNFGHLGAQRSRVYRPMAAVEALL